MSERNEEIDIVKMCHVTSSSMAIMDFEGLGKEYFDEDSDKEGDIAIDPIWEAQQISTFTAWCNAHLRKTNMKIENFDRDFRSGLKLMKLLEIISNDNLPAPDKGRMRFHKIANVNKALKFIEEKGVKLASIGAEEIVDGNVKMTLGMIWTIILRFTIQNILVEDSSAKEGLLLWCKRKTNGYKNIKVENFKNSFQDGLVFCALIDSHDKSLLDYDSLTPNQSSHNLKLAFTLAEKHLDVPQMLNIDDMIHNKDSDERSIMAYVSSYYHAIERKEKMHTALKNICKILSQEMEESQHSINSDALSKNLLKWVEHWIAEFQNRSQLDDQTILNVKISNFKNYRFFDKPEKNKDKLQIMYLNLKKSAEKKKYNICSTVQSKWNEMEKLENHYEEHISEQKYRIELIQNFLNSFEINFQVQRAWISNKIDLLVSKDYETANLSELKKLQRAAETFASNVGSHKARNDKIVNIAAELKRLNYKDMETIEKKVTIILNPWETLNHLNCQRIEKINNFLHALSEIDDLQLEFAKRVMPLYNWNQQVIQDLNDRFTFHSTDDIKDLIKAQEIFKSTVDEATDELTYVKSLTDRICRIVTSTGLQKIPLNPYTDIMLQDVQKAWIQLERSIPERDKTLKEALIKQIGLKDCKDNFAKFSKKLAEEMSDIQKSMFDLMSTNGTKRASKCQTFQARLTKCASQLNELESINQKLDEHHKIDNSKTPYSFEQLSAIHETLNYLLNEISKPSSPNLTSNQSDISLSNKVDEYKTCFKYFDRKNSDKLDKTQFRSCMLSLGYSLDENEENDKQFKDIMMLVDPENTGFITLTSFLDFIIQKNSNQGISEQFVESFKILANNQNAIKRTTILQELPDAIAKYCIENMPVKISSNGDNECYLDYCTFSEKLFHSTSNTMLNGST